MPRYDIVKEITGVPPYILYKNLNFDIAQQILYEIAADYKRGNEFIGVEIKDAGLSVHIKILGRSFYFSIKERNPFIEKMEWGMAFRYPENPINHVIYYIGKGVLIPENAGVFQIKERVSGVDTFRFECLNKSDLIRWDSEDLNQEEKEKN